MGKNGQYYYYSTYPNSTQQYRMKEQDYLRLVAEYQEKAIEIEMNDQGLITRLKVDTTHNYERKESLGPIHINADMHDSHIVITTKKIKTNKIISVTRTDFRHRPNNIQQRNFNWGPLFRVITWFRKLLKFK